MPQSLKHYLEYRVKNCRIKKENSIKSYWKRIKCKYIDVTGHGIDDGTELDIRDVQSLFSLLPDCPNEVDSGSRRT